MKKKKEETPQQHALMYAIVIQDTTYLDERLEMMRMLERMLALRSGEKLKGD